MRMERRQGSGGEISGQAKTRRGGEGIGDRSASIHWVSIPKYSTRAKVEIQPTPTPTPATSLGDDQQVDSERNRDVRSKPSLVYVGEPEKREIGVEQWAGA